MTDSNDVDIIAQLLTDDPDIFNEMATTTASVAAFPGGNQKPDDDDDDDDDDVEGGIKKHFVANSVTGGAEVVKGGERKSRKSAPGRSRPGGEILLADTQGCCEDKA